MSFEWEKARRRDKIRPEPVARYNPNKGLCEPLFVARYPDGLYLGVVAVGDKTFYARYDRSSRAWKGELRPWMLRRIRATFEQAVAEARQRDPLLWEGDYA